MKVFLGGSRKISRLNSDVRMRLDRIIEKSIPVIVGDANGADKSFQQYFAEKHYTLVEIFCAGGKCRNNIGHWPSRAIVSHRTQRDFNYYATKDRAMADDANYGLMVWDGDSLGTLMNVLRLVEKMKTVVVYVSPKKSFFEIKKKSDWDFFLSENASSMKGRIEKQFNLERQRDRGISQESFFN